MLEGNSSGFCRCFGPKCFSHAMQRSRIARESVARYPGRRGAWADQAWRSRELWYMTGGTKSNEGQDGGAPEQSERASSWWDNNLSPLGCRCTN